MSYRFNRLGAGIALALLSATPALAQVPLTPRALGMGGAYVAVARGNESLFLNPANLGLRGTPHWSFSFPQVSLGGTVLGPSVGDLPHILNFDDIPQSQRDEILAKIPGSGTEARYDLRVPALALQSGHFAFGVSYGSIGQHTVGRDLVELLFNGYEEGRTDYRVGDTRGTRATFVDFAAAYGRAFGPVSVGVGAHYIHGGSVLRSRMLEPRILLEERDIEVRYLSVLARGGQGYGVDFGLAVQPTPRITLSAAVSNAIASMRWSEQLRTRSLVLRRSDFENASGFGLLERYESSERDLDPSAESQTVLATADGLYEDAYFPAVGRVGAAWQLGTGTQLAASYQGKLTGGGLSDDWERNVGVGVQQRLGFLGFRAGYATNLEDGSMITGGLSVGPLQLGLAKLNDGNFEGAIRSGWIATAGFGVSTQGQLR